MEGDEEREGERGWLLYRVGRLLRTVNPTEGIAYLEEAERVAHAVGDTVLAAYSLFDRGSLWSFAQDQQRGLELMIAGLDALDTLPSEQIRSRSETATWVADVWPGRNANSRRRIEEETTLNPRHGTLAVFLAGAGRFAEAQSTAEAFLAHVSGLISPGPAVLSGVGDAESAIGLTAAAMGRPAEAQAAFRRAFEAYRAIEHLFLVGFSIGQRLYEVNLPYLTSDVAARRVLLAEVQEAGARVQRSNKPWGRRFEIMALLYEGLWGEAERVALQVEEGVAPTSQLLAFLGLGTIARWRGDFQGAWSRVHAGLPQGAAVEPGQHIFQFALPLFRLAIDLALDAGDLPTAATWLATHDRWLAWSGAVRGRADDRLLWARYHRVASDLNRANQTAIEALAEAAEPRQPLALLAAHRLSGEIATEIGCFADADQHLTASLSLADACAAPFERALTLMSIAELRVGEGRGDDAVSLLTEVRTIAEPLGAVPLLTRADTLADRIAASPAPAKSASSLSVREIEVLRLVAAGRSNPEIAQDLFVSPRTVTTHLTHVFAKLGVESRAEAVALGLRSGII